MGERVIAHVPRYARYLAPAFAVEVGAVLFALRLKGHNSRHPGVGRAGWQISSANVFDCAIDEAHETVSASAPKQPIGLQATTEAWSEAVGSPPAKGVADDDAELGDLSLAASVAFEVTQVRHDIVPPSPARNRPTTLRTMAYRAVKVAIMGINYAPEPTGIAPYTTGLARGLAERGHDVQVLTGYPHYPQWRRADAGSGFRSEEVRDGVRVRRFSHYVPRQLSWSGRVAMEMTFGMQLLSSRWGRPEVVVCVVPPLLAAVLAIGRARLTSHRPSVGILVQDLYSRGVAETAVASGLAARALCAAEAAATRMADGVAVIHAGFLPHLSERLGVDVRRVREIRNWTHVQAPDPLASAAFRHAHRWGSDEIVILHAGNMGYKQGLENVVAAAELAARTNTKARFVLLGDGNQRMSLEAIASGVPALEFLPPVSDKDFPNALGAADVLLVNERPGVAQMAVPSKLTSYFSAGKPILAATDTAGFTAGELAASGAGICVPADRPDLLLSEAIRIGTDRALGAQMGDAGRQYCEGMLSGDAALDRYEQWVINLADARRTGC